MVAMAVCLPCSVCPPPGLREPRPGIGREAGLGWPPPIQSPSRLSLQTQGTWIHEEPALLCAREVQSHLLPGSVLGTGHGSQRPGGEAGEAVLQRARPFANAPPCQAGFAAQALCPHPQVWRLRFHRARWHGREMAEPGPGPGVRDAQCACADSACPGCPQTAGRARAGSPVRLGSTQHLKPVVSGDGEQEGGVAGAPGPTQEQRSPGMCLPSKAWRVPPSRRKG